MGGQSFFLGLLVGNWECVLFWLAECPSEKNKSKKWEVWMSMGLMNEWMSEIDFSLYAVALMTVSCTHLVKGIESLIAALTNVLLTVLVKGWWGGGVHT